jgi:uncharacterized protein with NRDE domain
MCLVFISFQNDGSAPVKIGANREESRRRPTTSPVCCRQRGLRCLVAGADHGPDGSFPEMGTWLGVNEAGLAVAVTNRHDGELAWHEQIRSRGLLAVALLGFEEPGQAAQWAGAELSRGGYGGCNYLLASGRGALVVQAPGARRISVRSLEPGTHAMTNLDIDDLADPRIRFVHANLDTTDFVHSAARICRGPAIVLAGADRGTVSSSLLTTGAEITLYHLIGDPTGREYEVYRLIEPCEPSAARRDQST